MEHRIGPRSPISLNVDLCQGGNDLGCFLTKDIGPGGLSLKGKIRGLNNNSLLTVQVEQTAKGDTQYIELKAFVIHQGNNTIGLMWVEHHAGFAKATQRMPSLSV